MDNVILEQFQQFLAQQGLDNGTVTPNGGAGKPQPIELNIGGEKVSFQTAADLEKALNSTLEKNATAIATLEGALKTTQTPVATPVANSAEDLKVQFYEKFKEDPFAAIEMALNQNVFEGKVQNSGQVLREMAVNAEQNRQLLEVARFKDVNPGFNPQVDAGNLERIRQTLNLPVTAAGLDAAYAAGLKNGIFHMPQQNQQNQQVNQWGQPVVAAPPTPGRFQPQQQQDFSAANLGFDPITQSTLETMDLDKLETFLRTQGAFA